LWIVPTGDAGANFQSFITTLSKRYSTPHFVPHLTLVANIPLNTEAEYRAVVEKIESLAMSIEPFEITLGEYGYTNEEFRCLFLKTAPSRLLDATYDKVSEVLPQVNDEHFQAMPHMSVLYGSIDESL